MEERKRVPILIVDDEKAVRNLLTRVAQRAGFEAEGAKDGVEALEMLQKKSYEIVIVDLMMPRLSGYELIQKINEMKPRPAVIVATALTNGDVATLDDSMVRRVIRKPFDIKAVANALVETARYLTEQKAAAAEAVPVAPPQAAKLPIVIDTPKATVTIDVKPPPEEENGTPPPEEPPPEKPK